MGVFVSCSTGNNGPAKASLAKVAPWIMTIGAGTLDQDFPSPLTRVEKGQVVKEAGGNRNDTREHVGEWGRIGRRQPFVAGGGRRKEVQPSEGRFWVLSRRRWW